MMPPEDHHRLRVQGSRGAVRLDVDLAFAAPWTVIFGPSGSGKSSLLRAICGLVPKLTVDFQRWESDAWVPLGRVRTERRRLGYAPQNTAVFAHMTVHENIEFAAKCRTGAEARKSVEAAIEIFSLGPLLKRMPRELSGGERQGVSLARAFAVPAMKLMLLDEPFNGIDRRMRDTLLPRMRERLSALGVPAISVTHDVEEPLLLDAEVVLLDEGRIVGRGPARDALAEERRRMRNALDL